MLPEGKYELLSLDEHKSSQSPAHLSDLYWRGDIYAVPWRPLTREDAERLIPSPPGNVSPRARQLYATENLRHKDRVIAAFLAFFLGLFGVHKFYLGYNQAGFIMMTTTILGGICTCGLASAVVWVLGIVEGAFYLVKTQTEFEELYLLHPRDWL